MLFGSEKYIAIYNRNKNLESLKIGIAYVFTQYYGKVKVDSYDSLTLEERLTLHNVIILFKSDLTKDQNHYYYIIFLEICFVSIS